MIKNSELFQVTLVLVFLIVFFYMGFMCVVSSTFADLFVGYFTNSNIHDSARM